MTTTPAQRLRTLRFESKFDVEETARCLGVHESKIRRFELGSQEPTLTDICALLASYRTNFDALFSPEIEGAKADVYARIADYVPKTNGANEGKAKSYLRLKKYLNQLHGADC